MGPFRVASTHALPVGVVRWSDDRALSVVLKATFSLARSGAVAFAAEQMPISLDRPGTKSVPGGLDYPSDFVPFKPDADVLLVGHARQPKPEASLPVRLQVGKWSRLMVASTASPVPELTLSPAWLRDSATGEEAITGPSALSASTEASPEWYEPGFDFGQFNTASFEQLVPWLSPGSKLVVEGVFRDGRRRTVTLPRVRPHAAIVSLEQGIVDVQPMAADTLWVDGDTELCVVVWRSVHHFTQPLESTPRVVAVENSLESLDEYVAMARDATSDRIATERSHFSADPGGVFGVPIAAPMGASPAPAPASFEDWETQVVVSPRAATPGNPPELRRSKTMEIEGVPAPAGDLPFAESTADPLVMTHRLEPVEEVTSVGDPQPAPVGRDAARKGGLPFVDQPPPAAPPVQPVRAPQETMVFAPKPVSEATSDLPFVPVPKPQPDLLDDTADGDERPAVEGVLPFSDKGQAAPIRPVTPARQNEGTITDILNLDSLALPSEDGVPTPKLVQQRLAARKAGLGGDSVKAALGTMRLETSENPAVKDGEPDEVTPPAAVPPVAVSPAANVAGPARPAPPVLGGALGAGPTLVSPKSPAPETVGQGADIGGAKVASSEPAPSGSAAADEPAPPAHEPPALTIEKYADLKAELWQGKVSRAEVLDKYELNELAWKAEDEYWRGRLSEESKRGEAELVRIVTTALMKRR